MTKYHTKNVVQLVNKYNEHLMEYEQLVVCNIFNCACENINKDCFNDLEDISIAQLI